MSHRPLQALSGLLVVPILAAGLLLPADAAAQADADELRSAAAAVAPAWRSGDADALAGRLRPDGVRLHLPGRSHPALSVRLARAALAELHGSLGSGAVEVRQVRLLGGDPPRGFADLAWNPVAEGTREPVPHTVFVGLEHGDGAWWVVEIRVMPADGRPAPATPSETGLPTPDPTEPRWR